MALGERAVGQFALGQQTLSGNTFYTIAPVNGVYVLTGKPQTLTSTRTLPLAQGTYTLTGQAITPGLGMPAAQGTYTVSGQANTLGIGMPAAQGAYTLTGKPQSFAVALSTKPTTGVYTLTGNGQAVSYTPVGGTKVFGHKFINDVGNLSESNF